MDHNSYFKQICDYATVYYAYPGNMFIYTHYYMHPNVQITVFLVIDKKPAIWDPTIKDELMQTCIMCIQKALLSGLFHLNV